MDKTSITLGLRIGRILAGQRRKKPVAYLYGESQVRLPPLPEDWKKDEFPYAHIAIRDSYYFAYIFPQLPTTWNRTEYFPAPTKTYEVNGKESGIWNSSMYYPESKNWDDFGEPNDNEYGWNKLNDIVWANYDVKHIDGTLYMAASEPIPVYE